MKLCGVSAVCKGRGIGKNGQLPWRIPKDLKWFKDLTKGHIVIMGRKTYDSLPQKPLPDRYNIILTQNSELLKNKHGFDNVYFTNSHNVLNELADLRQAYGFSTAFVIGGRQIYELFMNLFQEMYITYIDASFEFDTKFPHFEHFKLDSYISDMEEEQKIRVSFLKYVKTAQLSDEYNYLDLLKNIMNRGGGREDRTGTGTLSVFARQLRFDLSNNTLPLLTTKFVGWKTVLKELLWFLRGDTNSKSLEKQGVNIWKLNSTRDFLDKRGLSHYEEGDIGPMYFFNIFHYGTEYQGCHTDYTGKGYDQMAELIKGLQEDPFSRRHLLTTYNPSTVSQSVLAPCHGIVIQFYVESHSPKRLSCHVYIRSSDTILGLPFNIASYAMLTHIIAKKVGMVAKELIISTGDTHIYMNHFEQAKEQLMRKPFPFPKFNVSDSIITKDWKELVVDDFDVIGYFSHEPIKAPMAV